MQKITKPGPYPPKNWLDLRNNGPEQDENRPNGNQNGVRIRTKVRIRIKIFRNRKKVYSSLLAVTRARFNIIYLEEICFPVQTATFKYSFLLG